MRSAHDCARLPSDASLRGTDPIDALAAAPTGLFGRAFSIPNIVSGDPGTTSHAPQELGMTDVTLNAPICRCPVARGRARDTAPRASTAPMPRDSMAMVHDGRS